MNGGSMRRDVEVRKVGGDDDEGQAEAVVDVARSRSVLAPTFAAGRGPPPR
jgi:hypothetical protein